MDFNLNLNCPSTSAGSSGFQVVHTHTHSNHSDFISIPAVPSLRPEFRTASFTQAEHEYARTRNQSVVEGLVKCLPAARLLEQHENELLETGVIGDQKTSLPSLEKRLRDFATSGACHGIFYATIYQHHGRFQPFTLARIIEFGCMQGVSFKEAVREVFVGGLQATEKLFTYNVFSEKDLNEGNRKRKRTDSRDRSAEIFKNNVDKVQNLLTSLRASSTSVTCLKGGAILLLKQKSTHNKQKDRFFFCFGLDGNAASFDWQQLEKILNDYRETGVPERPRLQLSDLGSDPDVQQQFEAIGSISHDTDNISRYNKDGVLSKPTQPFFPCIFIICWKMRQGRHTPYMLRIRLLRYLLDKNMKQVHALLHVPNAVVAGPKETSLLQVPFQAAERRVAEMRSDVRTRQRVTADDVQQEFGLQMPPVTNMASELTDYSSFKISMLEQGHLYWVKHQVNTDVFVMNDYSSATSKFQVMDFIQIHVSEGTVTSCTCDTQKTFLGTNVHGVCMHWRFLEEEILGLMERVEQADFVPESSIGRKLLQAWHGCNTGCVAVGPATGKTRKFCVIGRDDTMAFVHLSLDNSFVSCTSGECRWRMGSKKKLQGLNSAADLCPHLDIFKANEELWQPFRGDGADEEDDEAEHYPVVDENTDDQYQLPADMKNYFDSTTGLWDFGGLSKHRPSEEKDPKLKRNRQVRHNMGNLPRDERGFLTGHVLRPTVPESCPCGAEFADVNVIDEINLVSVRQSTLYMELGAVKCVVAARKCCQGACRVDYNPEEDSIFFWSESICIADEIGHIFLDRMFKMKCSFSGFCSNMNYTYKFSDETAASFVSVPTFINWFFSWAAAFKYDFREDVDPWCKHSPRILAGDGTHVGVALRNLKVSRIEEAEVEENVPSLHRRYDRVFLFQKEGISPRDLQSARKHLKSVCRKLKGDSNMVCINDDAANTLLLQICPEEARDVLQGLLLATFEHEILFALADVLFILGCDAPVSALLPYSCVGVVQDVVRNLQLAVPPTACLEPLSEVSPELKRLLKAASMAVIEKDKNDIFNFVLYLTERVVLVHSGDRAAQAPVPMPGSYNPPSGVAYYFTPTGEQVRKLPNYGSNSEARDGDPPSEEGRCRKVYPKVSRRGFSYTFFWFCPTHGHCYGFHIISGGEGRKDPFASMVKYLEEAPEAVFYDNACQLSEYCLNREPAFFKQTRFFYDCFHGFSHKCAKTFCSSRIPSLHVNSEICEQFNSRLQCIKYTGSHLSQPRFVFLVQLVLHFWNLEKTKLFRQKLEVAYRGML